MKRILSRKGWRNWGLGLMSYGKKHPNRRVYYVVEWCQGFRCYSLRLVRGLVHRGWMLGPCSGTLGIIADAVLRSCS